MLGKLRPTTAILVERRGTEKEEDSVVQADLLDFGDIVRVPHGASPPADGIVVLGESNFDESSLTGESRPVKKRVGDGVFSGTVNKDGPVSVQITGVVGKSMLDQIINIVRAGQAKRAPMEQIADVMTTYFVPVITDHTFISHILQKIALLLALCILPRVLDDERCLRVSFAMGFPANRRPACYTTSARFINPKQCRR